MALTSLQPPERGGVASLTVPGPSHRSPVLSASLYYSPTTPLLLPTTPHTPSVAAQHNTARASAACV